MLKQSYSIVLQSATFVNHVPAWPTKWFSIVSEARMPRVRRRRPSVSLARAPSHRVMTGPTPLGCARARVSFIGDRSVLLSLVFFLGSRVADPCASASWWYYWYRYAESKWSIIIGLRWNFLSYLFLSLYVANFIRLNIFVCIYTWYTFRMNNNVYDL